MRPSIALRLAAMFGAAALIVFSLIGLALHQVFVRELDRHQLLQLKTTFQIMEYVIARAHTPVAWQAVRAKLDDLTPPDESTRFWVWSADPAFAYGKSLDKVAALSPGKGIGQVRIEGWPHSLKTQVDDFPANGSRPAVRFMVGIDTAPYLLTEKALETALFALSALGIVLVTVLGYVIAKFGLKPVNDLSGEAEKLTPKNRSQRLNAAQLPRELSKLGSSFNGALDRLESSYQLLEMFNADVAHELRTPLANLIGQTQVALSRDRSASQLEEILQSNLEELERMRTIVNDMLFLTRADQGELAVRPASVSVAGEVGKAVEFLDFIMEEAGVAVRVEGDAEARLETSLFLRAVTNLLLNAIQHSPREGVIVVEIVPRVSEFASEVVISVSNPGPAISQANLPRIFDRFYRVDSARSNSKTSHGLGLSIVKAIAAMHRGTVFASSENGVTTVGFTILV